MKTPYTQAFLLFTRYFVSIGILLSILMIVPGYLQHHAIDTATVTRYVIPFAVAAAVGLTYYRLNKKKLSTTPEEHASTIPPSPEVLRLIRSGQRVRAVNLYRREAKVDVTTAATVITSIEADQSGGGSAVKNPNKTKR